MRCPDLVLPSHADFDVHFELQPSRTPHAVMGDNMSMRSLTFGSVRARSENNSIKYQTKATGIVLLQLSFPGDDWVSKRQKLHLLPVLFAPVNTCY